VTGALQLARDMRQTGGDFARDAGGNPRRIKRQRVEPDLAQPGSHRLIIQIGQFQAIGTRVGKRRVGGAAAAELGIQLDDMADIDDDQKRRPAFFCRQRAAVTLGLGAGALHAVVEAFGLHVLLELLRLQHKTPTPVGVDASLGTGAIAMPENDAALEYIGVIARVGTGRVGHWHVEQFAQLSDKTLRVGKFGTVGMLPAGDEGFGGHEDLYGRWCCAMASDSNSGSL
jgi:hypothetical protein